MRPFGPLSIQDLELGLAVPAVASLEMEAAAGMGRAKWLAKGAEEVKSVLPAAS